MTLNITVVSASGIHQSADFRLTAFEPGPDGRFVAIEDNSPKLVSLRYKDWGGYLTYCGVGTWKGKPTYVTAAEWITSLGPRPTFNEVVQVLQQRGSDWIADIDRRVGKFHSHSFVLVGYEHSVRRVAIVSNTHSTQGRLRDPLAAALHASIGGQSGTHVYVTGLDKTVSIEDRDVLKRLAKKGADANVLRARLAQLNAIAAGQPEANNGISASCICYSIDHRGAGAGEVYGSVAGPLAPIQILNGLNVTELIERQMGSGVQLRSSTVATSESSQATRAERISCTLGLNHRQAGLHVVGDDLGDMNSRRVEIASANEHGSIVGRLSDPVGAPERAFLWTRGQKIRDLGTLGGARSEAADVNSSNVVVGSSVTSNRGWEAFAWREETGMIGLGTLDANNSVASAVNELNTVVGSVYRSPSTLQDEYHRAFRWSSVQGMQLIPGIEGYWSSALDINSKGEILVACHDGRQMCSGVWSEDGGFRFIEASPGRPFHGSSINDSGTAVGTADDNSGVRRAVTWNVHTGVQQLPVSFSFHPSYIDSEGNIVGRDSRTPWAGAWLFTATGELVPLPGGSNHNLDARRVVGSSVYGHARGVSGKHVHPIRWDLHLHT